MLRVRHALSGNLLLEIPSKELLSGDVVQLVKEQLEAKLDAPIFRQRLLNHQNEVISTLDIHENEDDLELQVLVVPFCQVGDGMTWRRNLQRSDCHLCRVLLEKPQQPDGKGALHAAARYGHAEVVQLLLQARAWQDQPGRYEATPLLEAAESGTLKVTEILVDAKSDLNQMGLGRTTPLLAACERGHLAIARLLVERGADKERADARGVTPLLAAAGFCGSSLLVKLLLDAKASCTVLDTDGKTPLRLAAGMGHVEVVRCLLEALDALTAVDARDALGATALWAAARNGRVQVTELLLEKKAQQDARDIDGETPLLTAAETGHLQVVKVLLDANAEKEACDFDGRSPLRAAAERGRTAVVECLIEAGASVNATCDLGRTALYCAAWGCYGKLVEILLNANCDALKTDRDGVSPLHLVASRGHFLLLPHLAKSRDSFLVALHLRDAEGATALWRAAQKGQLEVVQYLLMAEADVNACDAGHQTPLQIANIKCHHQVVQFLRDFDSASTKRRRLLPPDE